MTPSGAVPVAAVAQVVRLRPQFVRGDKSWQPDCTYGTTPEFLALRDWQTLADGKPFDDKDVTGKNAVCLLGQTVVKQLFNNTGRGDDLTDY